MALLTLPQCSRLYGEIKLRDLVEGNISAFTWTVDFNSGCSGPGLKLDEMRLNLGQCETEFEMFQAWDYQSLTSENCNS